MSDEYMAMLAADANRYRWLRDNGQCDAKHGRGAIIGDKMQAKVAFRYWCGRSELDAAIDQAMEKAE